MTIALGKPTRIPENGAFTHPWGSPDFTLGSACTVDPTFDIVIPAYWSAEATTIGFDTPISMRALITRVGSTTQDYSGDGVPPTESDNRVLIEQNFSNGPSCSSFSSTNHFGYGSSNGFSHQWNESVSAGSARTSPFFIIVKDYLSPTSPNGDTALLNWIVLKPLSGGNFDDQSMLYVDTDGGFMGIYSEKGIMLSGKIVAPAMPTPTPRPTPTLRPTVVATQAPPFSVCDTVVTTPRSDVPGDGIRVPTFLVCDTVVTSYSAYLRETARTSSNILAMLEAGTVLSVTGGPYRDYESDYVYWQIAVNATGQVGYVNQDAIEPVPDGE